MKILFIPFGSIFLVYSENSCMYSCFIVWLCTKLHACTLVLYLGCAHWGERKQTWREERERGREKN